MHVAVTIDPTAAWTAHQLRNALFTELHPRRVRIVGTTIPDEVLVLHAMLELTDAVDVVDPGAQRQLIHEQFV